MEKDIMIVIISLWYGLTFTANEKFKNKINKLGKDDDRIPILQLVTSRRKNPNEN